LQVKGQQVKQSRTMGSVQSIMFENGMFYGVSDPRRPDAGTVAVK